MSEAAKLTEAGVIPKMERVSWIQRDGQLRLRYAKEDYLVGMMFVVRMGEVFIN